MKNNAAIRYFKKFLHNNLCNKYDSPLAIAINIAITAIDKQIPKKPMKQKVKILPEYRSELCPYIEIIYCPKCKSTDLCYGYPCKCGQCLKWK